MESKHHHPTFSVSSDDIENVLVSDIDNCGITFWNQDENCISSHVVDFAVTLKAKIIILNTHRNMSVYKDKQVFKMVPQYKKVKNDKFDPDAIVYLSLIGANMAANISDKAGYQVQCVGISTPDDLSKNAAKLPLNEQMGYGHKTVMLNYEAKQIALNSQTTKALKRDNKYNHVDLPVAVDDVIDSKLLNDIIHGGDEVEENGILTSTDISTKNPQCIQIAWHLGCKLAIENPKRKYHLHTCDDHEPILHNGRRISPNDLPKNIIVTFYKHNAGHVGRNIQKLKFIPYATIEGTAELSAMKSVNLQSVIDDTLKFVFRYRKQDSDNTKVLISREAFSMRDGKPVDVGFPIISNPVDEKVAPVAVPRPITSSPKAEFKWLVVAIGFLIGFAIGVVMGVINPDEFVAWFVGSIGGGTMVAAGAAAAKYFCDKSAMREAVKVQHDRNSVPPASSAPSLASSTVQLTRLAVMPVPNVFPEHKLNSPNVMTPTTSANDANQRVVEARAVLIPGDSVDDSQSRGFSHTVQ